MTDFDAAGLVKIQRPLRSTVNPGVHDLKSGDNSYELAFQGSRISQALSPSPCCSSGVTACSPWCGPWDWPANMPKRLISENANPFYSCLSPKVPKPWNRSANSLNMGNEPIPACLSNPLSIALSFQRGPINLRATPKHSRLRISS